jgi:hypothetical protein
MKKALTPRQAAQHYDFTTLDKVHVRNLSFLEFNAISDVLEDCNQHSENTVFLACRVGTDADIEEAREILLSHRAARYLTPHLSERRHALLSKLSGIPDETPAEKAIPRACRDPWQEMADFLADYAAALANCRALDALGEPYPDLPACLAAGQSAAFLANSTAAALADLETFNA